MDAIIGYLVQGDVGSVALSVRFLVGRCTMERAVAETASTR